MCSPEANRNAPAVDRCRVLLNIGRTLVETRSADELYRAIYLNAAKVVDTSGFHLSLYDEEADAATVVFRVDQGEETEARITYRGSDSEVIRTGKSLSLQGTQGHSGADLALFDGGNESEARRSAISVPLLSGDRVLGSITVHTSRADAYGEDDLQLLERLADLAAIALDNVRHIEELRRRSLEAEKMEDIGRLLTSSLNLDEVLARVSMATMDLLDVDGADVWAIEGKTARVRTSVGVIPIPVDTVWTLSDAIYDTVVKRVKPLLIEDVTRYDDLPDTVRPFFDRGSAVVVPVVIRERVAGGLSARSKRARCFTEYDVRLLGRLAGQASIALTNAELHASIQDLSLTDSLTGLPNRRHLQLHLEKEIAAAQRGRPLALVLFDLDSFKHYNDAFGHVVGDRILKAFGQVLLDENRAMNLVARYGGDEFVAVLAESGAKGAHHLRKRVDTRVKADRVLSSYGVTVASGVAEFTVGEAQGIEELIHAADRQMYENKARTTL